jgi:hypothetical protein
LIKVCKINFSGKKGKKMTKAQLKYTSVGKSYISGHLAVDGTGKTIRIPVTPEQQKELGENPQFFLVTITAEKIEETVVAQDQSGKFQIRIPSHPHKVDYVRAVSVNENGSETEEECWFESDWCEEGSRCIGEILHTIKRICEFQSSSG